MRSFLYLLVFTVLFPIQNCFAKTNEFLFWGYKFRIELPQDTSKKVNLAILFHGCKQDADTISQGTDFISKALKSNLAVLIPEQKITFNNDRCWNWFFGMNQSRSMGELKLVHEALEYAKVLYQFDTNKIFTVGLSAGAVSALGYAYCYREQVYKTAVHSGLAFASADSAEEANSILLNPDLIQRQILGELAFNCADVAPNRLTDFILFHGKNDLRVNVNHSYLIKDQALDFLDLNDDIRLNQSIIYQNSVHYVDSTEGKYSYMVEKVFNHDFKIELFLVDELKHAWSGGNPVSSNFDAHGPDATQIIIDRFIR